MATIPIVGLPQAGEPPAGAPPSAQPAVQPAVQSAPSPVGAAFDALAEDYDAQFSDHPAGRIVRRAVWDVLDARFGDGDRVLDLGCGTGIDAVHLAQRGVAVVALDVSAAMVARTRAAARTAGLGRRVSAFAADIGAPSTWPAAVSGSGSAFSGAVSNFGALNCVADLRPLGDALAAVVRPGGVMVAVVMARWCAWETLAGAARLDARRATRRWRGHAAADLGTGPWSVWYRSPAAVARALGPAWRLRRAVPIGAVVPPTWAVREGSAFDRPWLWRFWSRAEAVARRLPTATAWADHVAIEVVRTAVTAPRP